jgi:hypothetical protein
MKLKDIKPLRENASDQKFTNTPEFKSFFRASKLVKNNTPIVLYHGTTARDEKNPAAAIKTFKPSPDGLLGRGIYLTPDRDYAGTYASQDGGYVIPVYARLVNPLIIQYSPDGEEVVRRIAAALDDNFHTAGAARRWAREQYEDWAGIGDEEFYDMLGDHDGVMLMKGDEIVELTVLSSAQLKSAIGNNGEYREYAGIHEATLSELFDSGAAEHEWDTEGVAHMNAKFAVEKRKYQVDFDRKANGLDWEVKFALVTFFDTKKTELTRTGNEFQVFAKVVSIIKEFITKNSPKTLYFTADKDVPSRDDTYAKLLKYFTDELLSMGYTTRRESSTINKFVITKK